MSTEKQAKQATENRPSEKAFGGSFLERRTDDLYLTLVENSVVGLGLYIPGEALVFCNQRLVDITGHTMEEVVDPDFDVMSLFLEEDRALIAQNIRRRVAGEHILPYEVSLARKDNKREVVEVKNVPVMYGAKRVIQVQLIDVTERKQTEEVLKSLRPLMRPLRKRAAF